MPRQSRHKATARRPQPTGNVTSCAESTESAEFSGLASFDTHSCKNCTTGDCQFCKIGVAGGVSDAVISRRDAETARGKERRTIHINFGSPSHPADNLSLRDTVVTIPNTKARRKPCHSLLSLRLCASVSGEIRAARVRACGTLCCLCASARKLQLTSARRLSRGTAGQARSGPSFRRVHQEAVVRCGDSAFRLGLSSAPSGSSLGSTWATSTRFWSPPNDCR